MSPIRNSISCSVSLSSFARPTVSIASSMACPSSELHRRKCFIACRSIHLYSQAHAGTHYAHKHTFSCFFFKNVEQTSDLFRRKMWWERNVQQKQELPIMLQNACAKCIPSIQLSCLRLPMFLVLQNSRHKNWGGVCHMACHTCCEAYHSLIYTTV